MYICPNCKETLQTSEPDSPRQFPALTLAGGLLGTVAGVVSGAVLLVPLGLFAGAAADVRRCGSCGRPIAEGEEGYRAMTEFDDGLGGQVYRPAAPRSPSPTASQGPGPAQSSYGGQGLAQTASSSKPPPSELAPSPVRGRAQSDFVFDEMGGTFVEKQPPSDNRTLFDEPLDGPSAQFETDANDGAFGMSLDDVFTDPFLDPGLLDADPFADPGPFPEPPIEALPL